MVYMQKLASFGCRLWLLRMLPCPVGRASPSCWQDTLFVDLPEFMFAVLNGFVDLVTLYSSRL